MNEYRCIAVGGYETHRIIAEVIAFINEVKLIKVNRQEKQSRVSKIGENLKVIFCVWLSVYIDWFIVVIRGWPKGSEVES